MKTTTVLLGYEVGTAKAVEIPIAHMCVTGQTQQAGKTTALEALVTRSGLRAVTFITKRGEGSFVAGRRMQPFFRERADWQFVASLIDATMGEKNKLLRAWLMKVCRNTRTLAEVQANVAAAQVTARGFSESIYTEIAGYLELVVPQLAELPPAANVIIGPGLNVMDLSPYRAELQGLVIRSVIEHVYEHENDVVTVIPEAWEFLPEGRGSPVKLAAETLIRKGAALRNFIWVDAQDLGGLWKTIVRAAAVYLVGVQREANEVKRTLGNLPASAPKLAAADVASLELGQFYACWGRHAIKTYVQPAWLSTEAAQSVSLGDVRPKPDLSINRREDSVTKDEAARVTRENETLKAENADLRRRLEALEAAAHGTTHDGDRKDAAPTRALARPNHARDAEHVPPNGRDGVRAAAGGGAAGASRVWSAEESLGNEALYQAFKARLITEAATDPTVLRILTTRPELEVQIERRIVQADGSTTKGRAARLLQSGFLEDTRRFGEILKELERTGPRINNNSLSVSLKDLIVHGFLTKEGADGYRGVPGMIVRIVEGA